MYVPSHEGWYVWDNRTMRGCACLVGCLLTCFGKHWSECVCVSSTFLFDFIQTEMDYQSWCYFSNKSAPGISIQYGEHCWQSCGGWSGMWWVECDVVGGVWCGGWSVMWWVKCMWWVECMWWVYVFLAFCYFTYHTEILCCPLAYLYTLISWWSHGSPCHAQCFCWFRSMSSSQWPMRCANRVRTRGLLWCCSSKT